MTTREISNSDDVIDSRDIIGRIEELQDERQALADALEEIMDGDKPENASEDSDYADRLADATAELADWDADNGDELKALKALAEATEGYADDWQYGATLIRESYFVEYCQQLVEDIGDLPKGLPGYLVIDWEATADNLRVDYTAVDFDGVTYLVR